MLVLSVPTPFVWWIAISVVMQLVTGFFNGEGPLSAMLAVVGVAGSPLVLGALFQLLGTGVQAALGAQSTAGTIAGLVRRLPRPYNPRSRGAGGDGHPRGHHRSAVKSIGKGEALGVREQ
ncbi:MAG TPA: hypothetical protein VFR69_03705 [Rubrobacteraceae bacterium]|nr:hypothetical protein [Rubrobacteraceae bacterium]